MMTDMSVARKKAADSTTEKVHLVLEQSMALRSQG